MNAYFHDPEQYVDGIADAFRHVFGSSLLSILYGPSKATFLTNLHETDNPSGAGAVNAKKMDLHNNEVGRALGQGGPRSLDEETIRYLEYGSLSLTRPGRHLNNGMSLWIIGPFNSTRAQRRAMGYPIYSVATGRPIR